MEPKSLHRSITQTQDFDTSQTWSVAHNCELTAQIIHFFYNNTGPVAPELDTMLQTPQVLKKGIRLCECIRYLNVGLQC